MLDKNIYTLNYHKDNKCCNNHHLFNKIDECCKNKGNVFLMIFNTNQKKDSSIIKINNSNNLKIKELNKSSIKESVKLNLCDSIKKSKDDSITSTLDKSNKKKFICPCGSVIFEHTKYHHYKTQKHMCFVKGIKYESKQKGRSKIDISDEERKKRLHENKIKYLKKKYICKLCDKEITNIGKKSHFNSIMHKKNLNNITELYSEIYNQLLE